MMKGWAASGDCTPGVLLPLLTSLPGGSAVLARQAVTIAAQVADDCANPVTAGSVIAEFSNGDRPVLLAHVGNGSWEGTWRPAQPPGPVTVTVRAELPGLGIRGDNQAQVSVSSNPDSTVPFVAPGGVVSAAAGRPLAPLARGGFISIYGKNLADRVEAASVLPLKTQLGGVEVVLGEMSLPLQFVSDGQINTLIPYDTPVDTPLQLSVRRGVSRSIPEQVIVTAAQPAVFPLPQISPTQGAIVGSQGIAGPAAPVSAGDRVVIYCEGLGPVTPAVAAGAAAPFDPLARTANPVAVTIGGQDAAVEFAGLAPGFAGLYQVNAVVPPGVPQGDAVPLTVQVGGSTSASVTLAIQ